MNTVDEQPDSESVGALDALKFLLELCALAALAVWGADVGTGAGAVLLAIAAPLLAALLWARWASPRSGHRLPYPRRLIAELVVFGAAAVALVAVDAPALAVAFAALVCTQIALAHRVR